jgi:hypothetical protein
METARLSFAQEHQYALEAVFPGLHNSSIYRAYEIMGDLDVGAMAAAVNAVCAQHQALRAVVDISGSDVMQKARSRAESQSSIACIAPRNCTEAQFSAYVHKTLRADLTASWDWHNEMPVKAKLIRRDSGCHVLTLCARHLMVDYRSLLTLEGELWERYAAYHKGEDARSSDQAPRFFDAIEIQRNRVSSAQRRENALYWLDKLPPELWKFGTQTTRPDDGQALSIKCDPILISGNRLEEIGAACRSASATRFQFALAAIAKSLSCIMADRPMVILVVMDSRPAAWRQIVGMFVQAHPIVLRVDPANDIGGVLDQVKRAVLNGMRHLHVDSELMVELRRSRPDSCRAADLSCVTVTHIQHGAEAVARTQPDELEIHQFGSGQNAAEANGLMITIDEGTDNLGIYMDISESVISQADAELFETTLRGLLLP